MITSKNGQNLIKKYEGLKLSTYRCPSGILTIGWGHTGSDVKENMTITYERAEELFKNDLKRFENYVNTYLKDRNLNQNQFDALVSFTFNLGVKNLKTLIKNRTLSQISNAILLYNKCCGKTLNGLILRRKEEKELFCAR